MTQPSKGTESKQIASMKKPTWRKDYKRGSTIFKKSRPIRKDGEGDVGEKWGWRCALCGKYCRDDLFERIYEMHEILHILQQMRGHYSNDYFEPMFDGEKEP